MNRTRTTWPLFALLSAAIFVAGSARAEDPVDLKKKILNFNKITGEEPLTNKVKELVKDPEGTAKLLKTAEEMVKEDSKQFKINGALVLARTAIFQKKYELGLQFYKICSDLAEKSKNTSKLEEGYVGQLLILNELKRYDQTEKVARSFLDIKSDDEKLEEMKLGVVMEYMIPAQAKQGKIAEALKHVEELDSQYKGEWSIVRLKGWVQFEAGRFEDCVKSYNEAIDLVNKSDNLTPARQEQQIASLRYFLSGVYVEMNDINKAAEQLQILLKKKPDYPGYNNDLGYIWADHDMNLDESEKLIRKALDEDRKLRKLDKDLTKDEDKDKAEYLDSLGWVLYKKKKFAEAKVPLLEAIKDPDTGQHIEIFDHLADVHMALGEKAEAIAIWKKALDLDVSGKRDLKRQQDVLKKIKAAEGK